MRLSRVALVVALGMVALTGCGQTEQTVMLNPTQTGPENLTGEPTPPPMPEGKTVVADGQLESPYPSLALSFGGGVSGQVLTITAKPGDVVRAGELLAELDDADLRRAVEDAELALDRAIVDRDRALEQWKQDLADAEQSLAGAERALTTAQLEYSETSLEEARTSLEWAQKAEHDREWEYNQALTAWPPRPADAYYDAWQRAIRDRELTEMRLADAQDAHRATYLGLEAREADVIQAERKLDVLRDGIEPAYQRAIEDAEQALVQAQEALVHAHLVAPWEAILLSVNVAPKAAVGVGTPIVTLLSIQDGLRFVTQDLSEQHIADVYPGQRAVVTLRTFPESPLEGVVEAVVPQVGETAAEANARFTVYVTLEQTEGLRLLPGLTGRAEIYTEE